MTPSCPGGIAGAGYAWPPRRIHLDHMQSRRRPNLSALQRFRVPSLSRQAYYVKSPFHDRLIL